MLSCFRMCNSINGLLSQHAVAGAQVEAIRQSQESSVPISPIVWWMAYYSLSSQKASEHQSMETDVQCAFVHSLGRPPSWEVDETNGLVFGKWPSCFGHAVHFYQGGQRTSQPALVAAFWGKAGTKHSRTIDQQTSVVGPNRKT